MAQSEIVGFSRFFSDGDFPVRHGSLPWSFVAGKLNELNGNLYCLYMEVSIVMGVPQNGWFIRGNPTKMDDLGVPLFEETTIHVRDEMSKTYSVIVSFTW